jgi:hypothetical protein
MTSPLWQLTAVVVLGGVAAAVLAALVAHLAGSGDAPPGVPPRVRRVAVLGTAGAYVLRVGAVAASVAALLAALGGPFRAPGGVVAVLFLVAAVAALVLYAALYVLIKRD